LSAVVIIIIISGWVDALNHIEIAEIAAINHQPLSLSHEASARFTHLAFAP
jgi:hypothetical protein